ncbi:MAG: glycosyltransferase [Ferrovibrio sp.]
MAGPRVLIWVQHLLGVGHLHRAASIARGLLRQGATPLLVSGGLPDPTLHGIDGIGFVQLPPARARDATFKILLDINGQVATEQWKSTRSAMLQDVVRNFAPDMVITELFPFGRRQMRFEMMPLLKMLRSMERRPLIFCSVRDILVDRGKPQHDIDSITWLQEYFDAALVHGDPSIIAFENTFPMAEKIRHMLIYTGYIAEQNLIPETEAGVDEVLVSAGGGAVGMALFQAAIEARKLSVARTATWRILVSPLENPTNITTLRDMAPPGVIIEPVRHDFPGMLRHCLLSISKAGYNTMMETLGAGTRAVVVPFVGGNETEQALRAALLAKRGLLHMLPEPDMTPQTLAAVVDHALASPKPDPNAIRLDGADETARRIRIEVEKWRR